VRDGRRKEFAKFAAFQDPAKRERIPDPNAEEAFRASIPDLSEAERPSHAAILDLHRHLLMLRRERIVPHLAGAASLGAEAIGEGAVLARWRLGDGSRLAIACNLAASAASTTAWEGELLFESADGAATLLASGTLPAQACVALVEPPDAGAAPTEKVVG
jgi:maltooligosyltrehalose trehalohydrolase